MEELRAAFQKLQSSIYKQWGSIPTEIAGELNIISMEINKLENAEPVTQGAD